MPISNETRDIVNLPKRQSYRPELMELKEEIDKFL